MEERMTRMEGHVSKLQVDVSKLQIDVSKLQVDMEHVKTDVVEIKGDIRTLNTKFDGLKDSIHSAKIWALIIVGGVLTVMARGFGWI